MKFLLSLSLKVKIIIAACIAAAAAITAAVIIINSEDAYRVIKVFEIEGEAVVIRENTGELDAYEGMNLESGDILSVSIGSYMRISLDSDKYILLDGGTVLELIAKGSANDSRTTVNLKEGTILNEITNTLSANSSYEVNTPKATMAVRGTSFKVTVTKTDGGGYITDIDTINDRVLVRLYDKDGNFKDAEALVTEGNRVTILTDPNEETGNAPELDGNAYFVFREDGDTFTSCGDLDPVYPSDYSAFSEIVRKAALASNDSRLLLLDKEIADKLRGNDKDSGEAETSATTETAAVTEKIKTETSDETSDTTASMQITTAVNLPVQDISETTTVPAAAATEQDPVIPSELTTLSETALSITENSETESIIIDTEKETSKTTTAAPAAPIQSTAEKTTVTESIFYTYMPMPTVIPVPTGTTSVTTHIESVMPSEIPTVTADTESVTITETAPESQPIIHNVRFIDDDGNIVSTSEIEDNGQIGTLPIIAEKKGYTAKWVSSGIDVTTDTVISADMEITAQYTPRPVTVRIYAPYGSHPGDTYDVVRLFTVLYDGKLTDNTEDLTVKSLSEYVDGRYSDYFETIGRNYILSNITVGTCVGETLTDDTLIAGDNVYAENEELYIDIRFIYQLIS